MGADGDGSVTLWLGSLKDGDLAAAQPLWERYFARLVGLARARLRSVHRAGADEDEEDAALSAFHSVCAAAAAGRFPALTGRDDLWRLLVTVTARKAAGQVRRRGRRKRGGGRVVGEADLGRPGGGGPAARDQVVGPEPTPEFAAMVAEEYDRLLDALGDDGLRRVALWRLEGFAVEEIADLLGCTVRTAGRRLELIRKIWRGAADDASDAP